MTDQCHRCTMRGDFAGCKATPCNIHESWHVEQLNATISRLEAELAEARKPDCRTCTHYYETEDDCYLHRRATPIVCINGDAYVIHGEPVRLYEVNAAMAGGEQ